MINKTYSLKSKSGKGTVLLLNSTFAPKESTKDSEIDTFDQTLLYILLFFFSNEKKVLIGSLWKSFVLGDRGNTDVVEGDTLDMVVWCI